ncbi:NAD(P)(+) transhydrogenase (AB-specific) [Ignisphaera aggregans DSM 17230]|uniref:proton-translocating NAD(P)(+) transhydrogenase n=1 Tax=Ignisphaera aggregans (strain DSM 17230 / JCM 13409 / AQ1.S1) TaxID=583356 RepID=E0SNM2_IGNAA|nr:NAD(P)(+) transhydrogenase (AB-specific) [Ignisphaera aggregans DSM 17230]
MNICCFNESNDVEKRVAITPDVVSTLKKAGYDVVIESGAGVSAGFSDDEYIERGAVIGARDEMVGRCDIVFALSRKVLDMGLREGAIVIGGLNPYDNPKELLRYVDRKLTLFSLELIPRISKAQSMDILTSMGFIAGYRAVILAASYLQKMIPMMSTPAALITPAKVLVIGAGVAGLTALAIAKRLGADTYGYDIRPAAKEQIRSVGAKVVEMPIEARDVEDREGYARYMGEDFYAKQRKFFEEILKDFDIVITTAAVPGKEAPKLISEEAVKRMKRGSVIVDVVADRGGNCVLTKPGETVVRYGVIIIGPINLPSQLPYHASILYSRNLANFLLYISKGGAINIDISDEIISDTLIMYKGEIVSKKFKELIGVR